MIIKREFNYIETHLTHHCNLNCASCTHYAPLVTELWFKDCDDFIKEIAQISALAGNSIKTFRLLGGEPLLHPDLLKFCFISREAFPYASIEIVTNGILIMEQSDEFFNKLNTWNIGIYLSDYYLSSEIKKFLTQKIKNLRISKPANFIKPALNFHSIDTKENNFYECINRFESPCYNLRDGYLYLCPTMAYFDFFLKYYNIKINDMENFDIKNFGIDIFKASRLDIEQYLNTPNTFCKYCDMKSKLLSVGHSISKKNMSEWVG